MMRFFIHFLLLVVCFSYKVNAQAPEMNSTIPNLVPPSPTVAGMMKFEEVSVNKYNGLPTISIPLFSTSTLSKDISINLALAYHPASIATSEAASYVGLGWNLEGSGVISRTIRGYPDENTQTKELGIWNQSNLYHSVMESLTQSGSMTESQLLNYEKVLFEHNELGKYDLEYDLYQFNFLGKTGRFIIKKNGVNYTIVRLDAGDNLQIKVVMNSSNVVQKFTIRDELGNIYIFDQIETTHVIGASENAYVYNSAYHLSQIFNITGELLVQYLYNETEEMEERISTHSQSYSVVTETVLEDVLIPRCDIEYRFEYPTINQKSIQRTSKTKKLLGIDVINIAHVVFELREGRSDSERGGNYNLNSITIKDWDNNSIKKFGLNYDFMETAQWLGPRMFLNEVKIENFKNPEIQKYKLTYRRLNEMGLSLKLTSDHWQYFNLKPGCYENVGYYRETTPREVTLDILQKMTLPTGGSIVYEFESNTYSYIGNTVLTDFSKNPNNFEKEVHTLTVNTLDAYSLGFRINEKMQACLDANAIFNCSNAQYFISLYNILDDIHPVSVFSVSLDDDPNTPENGLLPRMVDLEPGSYYMKVTSVLRPDECPLSFGSMTVTLFKPKNTIKKELVGGGCRIKRIGYFDSDVDFDYYKPLTIDEPQIIFPVKEKTYEYNFFDDQQKSSGSLAYGVPVYEYIKSYRAYEKCPARIVEGIPIYRTCGIFLSIDVVDIQGNTLGQKTHGADVGYKNVREYERNYISNGHTDFTFLSPIDYSEYINPAYPFIAPRNIDYKRGHLVKEAIYKSNEINPIQTSEFSYVFEEYEEITGLRTFNVNYNCPFSSGYPTYELYKEKGETLTINTYNSTYEYCGPVTSFIGHSINREAFGWAKMVSKKTVEFNNTNNPITTLESYTYNPINRKIASINTFRLGNPENRTEITYFIDPNVNINNRISAPEMIKKYVDDKLVSTTKTEFGLDVFAGSEYQPKYIKSAKGNEPLEAEYEITRYTTGLRPQEIKKKDGTKIVYLYGNHDAYLVCQIENISFTDLMTNSILNNVENAFDSSEFSINQLNVHNTIKTSFPLAKITSYVHQPLIGVKAVIDPRGNVTKYFYDGFGRLETVKDKKDTILSENVYNIKTQ